jgi:signal transduction histidine kinase
VFDRGEWLQALATHLLGERGFGMAITRFDEPRKAPRFAAVLRSSRRMTSARQVPGSVRPMDGTWWDRLRRVDHRIWDGLLALVVLVLGVLAFAARARTPGEPAGLGLALVIVAAVALAWRRRAPLVVAAIVAAAVSTAALFGYWPEFVALNVIALYTAAANVDRRRFLTILVPVGVLSSVAISVGEYSERGLNWVEIAFGLVVSAGLPILVGRMTFNRRRRVARDHNLAARDAVIVERATIARELHDVVAHHMSVMVVQAGAARSVVETAPDAAADALRQIEVSGRTGLTEMRRLLEILKADRADGDLAPQPGLAHLDELLDGMRATGLRVEAVVEGEPRPLPPGVDLSAYRIVQEALTNSLRHAGGASARVRLRYEPDALELEVIDDGPGATADSIGGGHGLIGMRERAQLFGGQVEAGSRPGGGFAVRARLPSESQA